jgi:hypothetical protein
MNLTRNERTGQEENREQEQGFEAGTDGPAVGSVRAGWAEGGKGKEVTVVKGEPLPPSPEPGMTYDLTDPTKNKSGRSR